MLERLLTTGLVPIFILASLVVSGGGCTTSPGTARNEDPSGGEKANADGPNLEHSRAPDLGGESAGEQNVTSGDRAEALSQRPASSPAEQNASTQAGSSAAIVEIVQPALPFVTLRFPASPEEIRDEALKVAEDLVQRQPGTADPLEVKARIHFLLGENELAKQSWQKALELDADYAYAIHGLGKIAALNSDFTTAIQYLQKAVVALPGFEEPVLELSDAQLKSGDVEGALKVLQKYAKDNSQSVEAHLRLGQALLANRQYAEAKAAFEKSLELRPNLPRAQEGLGKALVRLGQRDEARALLQAQRDSRQQERGNRTAEEAFADECRDYCARYVFAARVYLNGGAVAQAEKILEKATILDPANTQAWTLLLTHYQTQGDLVTAVERAESMRDQNPDNAGCHFTCGVLQAKSGKVKEAAASLEEVIRLAPESHSGYETLARLLIETRADLTRATELAAAAVEIRGSASDHELLAQAFASTGRFGEAHASLSRAIELDPQNANYRVAMQQLEQFRESQKK